MVQNVSHFSTELSDNVVSIPCLHVTMLVNVYDVMETLWRPASSHHCSRLHLQKASDDLNFGQR